MSPAKRNRSQKKDDVLILVMGPTGVGKSTFINNVVGYAAAGVGKSLKSCTANIQDICVPCPGDPSRRLVLIDTPGFDDTYVSDVEILERIASWLKKTYTEKKTLSGILYLHDITQTRMLGSLRHNYQMFTKLCGIDAAKYIVFVTTKWDRLPYDEGQDRENQLREEFWHDLIGKGSSVSRFSNNIASDDQYRAMSIIEAVLAKDTFLQNILIQKELVDLLKILPETEAGNTLRFTLKELLTTYKNEASRLKKSRTSADDQQTTKVREDTEARLRTTIAQIETLKIPMRRRFPFLRFFGLS